MRVHDKPSLPPKSWWKASIFIGGCMFIGFLGSYLGGAFVKQPWYDDSAKPGLWPPQWVFPVVWIGNYTFMGLAVWQLWEYRQKKSIVKSLTAFIVHLLHNFLFILIVYHFKKKSVYVLMDTIGLISGWLTAGMFMRISKASGLLMIPYLCWLCFTTFIKILWWRININRGKR